MRCPRSLVTATPHVVPVFRSSQLATSISNVTPPPLSTTFLCPLLPVTVSPTKIGGRFLFCQRGLSFSGKSPPSLLNDKYRLIPSSGVNRSVTRPPCTSIVWLHRLAIASMLWLTNKIVRPSLTTSLIFPRHFF